jgi:SNF2 family DNA or RNA helicase
LKIIRSEEFFGLLYDNHRDEHADARFAKEKCGFRFDPITGMLLGDAAAVDELRKHKLTLRRTLNISKAALELYKESGHKVLSAVEQSHAKDSDMIIPVPSGLELLPFQKAGVAYAAQRKTVLLADEMGLGKSPQAICTVNTFPDARRILIVCPASLKHNWRREWTRWDVKGLSVQIVDGTKPIEFTGQVVILNYDILAGHRVALKDSEPWHAAIFDECHYLKNGRTDRTLEVFGGIRRNPDRTIKERFAPIPARRVLLLSGTPLVNKPKELWPLIQAIDPNGLGANWFHYAKRYCEMVSWETPGPNGKPKTMYKWDGASNLEELQEEMRKRFMVRRLKKDVLTDLPAKRRQVIVLEPGKRLAKLVAKEVKTYEEHSAKLKTQDTPSELALEFQGLAEMREEIALQKVPFAVEHIKEILNEKEKVVVFTHHHSVTDLLSSAFGLEAVVVDGRTANANRQLAVDRFQNETSCRIFIGGIQAAGVGLTLTAASVVVFVELDWVPGNLSQAEDRCHRIGQKESVLIQHLVLEGSLDEHVVETIIKKQEIIDKTLDKNNA